MNKDALPEDTSNSVLAFKEALQSARELLRFKSDYYYCCFFFLLFIELITKSSFSSNDFEATYTGLFFIF